jgi:hypothetical protein
LLSDLLRTIVGVAEQHEANEAATPLVLRTPTIVRMDRTGW